MKRIASIRIPDAADLGPALRDLRLLHQLSLNDLERETGMGSTLLGNYERGVNAPSPKSLAKIINFYGYDLALLPREQA